MARTTHWADDTAERILRSRPDREPYTCASGITPSGTVHIGNFREIISVELVVRALRDRGAPVRFIYSWDDYDAFRKVPANMPRREELNSWLRHPIVDVPDPWNTHESYARHHQAELEAVLPDLGIRPEYLYQSDRYRASEYADGIRTALQHRDRIRQILNEHRTEPLPDDWWPILVFSSFSGTDRTEIIGWDGEWGLSYRCLDTGKQDALDLRNTGLVKLPWRVDWPMRWARERVDFEPAGKEHHSAGGSFDTAKAISGTIYGWEAPVTFKYDFVSIKGMGGKISSSLGNVLSVPDVLAVYQPEVLRYLFAGTRPNAEFAISFDLDVIKIYEDYDRSERAFFGAQELGTDRRIREARVYELSQVDGVPASLPLQIPFRHLTTYLLVAEGDVDAALVAMPGYREAAADPDFARRARLRAACAWNWLQNHAPDEFRWQLADTDSLPVNMPEAFRQLIPALLDRGLPLIEQGKDAELHQLFYELARGAEQDPRDFFHWLYQALIHRDRGPRLAAFLVTLGADRAREILGVYAD